MRKKNSMFEDILSTVTRYFVVLVVVVVSLICLSGIRIVKSGESAIILRFGRLVGETYEEQVHEPGLLLAFPYIIDEVIMVPTGSVMEETVTTHYTPGNMTTMRNNGYVITGDQSIAVMTVSAKYTITDAVAYALNAADISKVINSSVSNAMVEAAAHRRVDDILTSEKEDFAREILTLSQKKLDRAEIGVLLSTVELTNVSMPAEVREIYNAVTSAAVEAATIVKQAEQYKANLIPQAEAEASALVNAALADKAKKIAAAESALAEFNGLKDDYAENADVVRIRVYTEKVMKALKKIGKVRLVEDGDSKIVIN